MRMWMVDPGKMCAQHLLGEHREVHMIIGSLLRKKNLKGFLENRLIEPLSISKRHDALVEEMHGRGYKHNTPVNTVPDTGYLGILESTRVDSRKSERDLAERCRECRKLLQYK